MIIHSCNNVDTLLWDHVIVECQTTYSPTAFDEKKHEKKVDTGGGGYSLTS